MNNFRPRLFHIQNEDELFEYFTQHAGYDDRYEIYQCAGLVSNDTADLFQKLKREWLDDIAYEAKLLLEV